MKKSLFIIIAFALFNCGCSSVNLLYRHADWYLQHKIDGYVSFNPRQEESIHREISNYLDWHRKHALPEYIIFLQNLNGTAQSGVRLKSGKITLLRVRLMNLYRKSLMPAIRPAAEILSSLDNRQIRELAHNLAEENNKQKLEVAGMGRDAYLDRRAYKTLDFLEELVGNLSREQRQKIMEMSRRLPVVRDIYIEQRETNQVRLIKLLSDNAGADRIASFMSRWILTPEATRTAQQQRDILAFETASDEMIANIQAMLTTKQKSHLDKKISFYIDELQNLTTDTKTANDSSR
jgi:hypothetical protein